MLVKEDKFDYFYKPEVCYFKEFDKWLFSPISFKDVD